MRSPFINIGFKDFSQKLKSWQFSSSLFQGNSLLGGLSFVTKVKLGAIALPLIVLLVEAVLRYVALASNVFDFGLFLNNHVNVLYAYHLGLSGHVQWFLFPFASVYNTLPPHEAPFLLITVQWLILASSVVLAWCYLGFIPGFALSLYYPLWVVGLFDFHFDCLVILILLVFFILCDRGRFCYAAATSMLLVFVKEPFALQAAFCGLYLFLLAFRLGNRLSRLQLVSAGALLVLWGASWFYVYIHWVLPYFGGVESVPIASEAFSWLGSNLLEIFWNMLLKSDIILLDIIDTPGKVRYLLMVFGLLAFIPLLSPSALIVAAPVLIISMASHLSNYYDYATHYTAGLIVPVIVAFRDGFAASRAKWSAVFPTQGPLYAITLVILLGGHWAFASSPISRLFWSDKVWSYSWRAYVPTQREETMKSAMLEFIPADSGISVSSQNTVNWGHLAHRKVYLPFPLGVILPHKVIDFSNRDLAGLWQFVRTGYKSEVITHDTYADYVVLDFKRPWFILDSGCDWLYGACSNEKKAAEFLNSVASALQRYDVIYSFDGFMILRRRL